MDIERISLGIQSTIFEAISKMDASNSKLLIVIKDNKYFSLLSIGDIQRAILKNKSLDQPITEILRENITIGDVNDNRSQLENLVLKEKIEFLPIIDAKQEIKDIIFWRDLTSSKIVNSEALSGLPVVIMAGGKGTRLRPITHVIPKPMVPIGEKSILQIIMEKFNSFGCTDFHFSVNYKAEMIEQHVLDMDLDCSASFFKEPEPLGTAGSLSLLQNKINSTFIVSNCDIVIDQDFEEVYKYHKQEGNSLTAIAALKRFSIPYGIMNVAENGQLNSLQEKPTFDYQVNAGVYFLEPEVMNFIPKNEFFNITDLMEDLMSAKKKVGVFPVSEGSWLDIGEWKEYQKTQEVFKARGL